MVLNTLRDKLEENNEFVDLDKEKKMKQYLYL